MTKSPPPLNPVFANRPVTIFAVMSALAQQHGAINLGQGFPDEDGPKGLLKLAADALVKGPNQYAPVPGMPELRQAVARANARFYGLDYDWNDVVVVTAGATEGLAAAFFAFLQPTDEAIVLAPTYDCYAPLIEAAGAVVKVVPLAPPRWRVDATSLAAAITPKTRVIVVNTPHNPAARAYTREELQAIADIAIANDLTVICDEVYEHLVFDGAAHIPLASLPGMAGRCVRIGSAGKTFSVTGWRIGYVSGPRHLIGVLTKAHSFIAYTCPSHLQRAVAAGLDFADEYYRDFLQEMQGKRDLIIDALATAGFDVLPCEATYFVNVDIRSVGADDDDAFCREITEKAGVTAVPVSAFYPGNDGPRHLARFCFCKRPEVLREASARLKAYFHR
ncbi:MAG: aminotransferase [Parvularculaceae bacterium]|nr:aminotransferase [Parvularculaceae bacterium]